MLGRVSKNSLEDPVNRQFLEAVPSRSLLGPWVAMERASYDVDAYSDSGALDLGLPVPKELRQAAPRRKADYTAGRYCVRAAMSRFQDDASEPYPVPRPSEGAPQWPEGLVGSISHARGQAVAVVAPSDKVLSLGTDIEKIMTPEVARRVEVDVCTSELRSLPSATLLRPKFVTAIFSAKESFFKCMFPLIDRMFWFNSVSVMLSYDMYGQPNKFRAYLTCDLPPYRKGWSARGHIWCDDGFILSAMALWQPDPARYSPCSIKGARMKSVLSA